MQLVWAPESHASLPLVCMFLATGWWMPVDFVSFLPPNNRGPDPGRTLSGGGVLLGWYRRWTGARYGSQKRACVLVNVATAVDWLCLRTERCERREQGSARNIVSQHQQFS